MLKCAIPRTFIIYLKFTAHINQVKVIQLYFLYIYKVVQICIFKAQIYFTHSRVFIFWMFMYILKEPWMQTSFFVRERLKLMNFKSTVSFNLQKVFLKVTKDHNDPERRLLQSHSTDSRWFLSARLRRISSWNNWRKVALFKQASEGLIYITLISLFHCPYNFHIYRISLTINDPVRYSPEVI